MGQSTRQHLQAGMRCRQQLLIAQEACDEGGYAEADCDLEGDSTPFALDKGCSQHAAMVICSNATQVLGALPVPKHMLETSGVKATVADRLTGHRKSSTRTLAKQLLNRWDPKPASAPAALPEPEPVPEGVASYASSMDPDLYTAGWNAVEVHPLNTSVTELREGSPAQLLTLNKERTLSLSEKDARLNPTMILLLAAPSRASSAPGTPSLGPGNAARSEDDESDIMDEELLLMLERQKEVSPAEPSA